MDPLTIGLLISAGVAAVSSAVGSGVSIWNANQQKKTNQANEDLMRQGWARDDTARVRMVQDLENAGLSKWLGAGASPMNSSPISLTSPNINTDNFGGFADALQHGFQNYIQKEQTKRQNLIMDKQATQLDNAIEIQEAEKAIKLAEQRIKEHDANVFTRRDTASTDPAMLKYVSEAVNTLKGTNEVGQKAREFIPGTKQFYEAVEEKRAEKKRVKAHNKYMRYTNSVNESKRKDKGDNWTPMTYTDWLSANQLPANSGTVQSYKSYAERR